MRYLPWLAGGAALALYLITLNPWISFTNMAQVAKVSGFSWQSEAYSPLYYAATAPLRLLPTRLVPMGVNVFSAVCAALALALLARAVRLLPHDRTHDQREREPSEGSVLSVPLAWLPPLLAVVACGLQLTFWEHATNATPEMLNLLGFAYVVRALLEYRLDGREGWLFKAALVYGAVMTGDWLMMGLLPVFVAALIWLRGLSFFNPRFLGRLLLFGLLGLSLYLLLPLLATLSKIEPLGFWQTLKMNVQSQQNLLVLLPRVFPKNVFLQLALISVLPVFVLSIRWASYFGDTSQLGVALTKFIFHIVHALFLVACLWVMLDPRFSPRHIGSGIPFLSLYFLSALSIGYFSGYFLLVFRPLNLRGRRPAPWDRGLNRLATIAVIVLALVSPALLLFKNLPVVRAANQNLLQDFVRQLGTQLPKGGYLLADDPRWALLTRSWLAQTDRDKDFVVVETWPLTSPGYHRYLRRAYGERWPFAAEAAQSTLLPTVFMLEALKRVEKSGDLYYLHPSFGFFFEHYYAEPHGMLYRLKPYGDDTLSAPMLSPALVAENQAFWETAAREVFPRILSTFAPHVPGQEPTLREQMMTRLHLPEEKDDGAHFAGSLYSRPLNYWGVALQKSGDLERAAAHFDMARQLNPRNVVAKINFEFNRGYRDGKRERVVMPSSVEDLFGEDYRSWDAVMSANGPFDEPNLCYAQGFTLFHNGLYRQSAHAFERVHTFAPDDAPTRLWLGQLNLMARKPARTLELTLGIVEQPERFDLGPTNRVDALCLAAKAQFQLNESQRGEALLESAIQAAPTNIYLLANAASAYSEHGRYSNALAVVDRQLALNPKDPDALLNKGYIHMRLNAYAEAILDMTQVLVLQTNKPEALLNRAIAYLNTDHLDAAKADYETLQRLYPGIHQVYYGLGDIALRQKDTNAAILQYQSYLSNAIPGAAETKFIEGRLKELKGGKPSKP